MTILRLCRAERISPVGFVLLLVELIFSLVGIGLLPVGVFLLLVEVIFLLVVEICIPGVIFR